MKTLLIVLLVTSGLFGAQPVIYPKGIVNVASYVRQGLPGGSIARGSVFAIFGTGLGPSNFVKVSAFPLQPALAGVSVRVTQGSTGVDALPVFVVDGQLNVIMPSNAPLGLVSVQVTYNGVKSNPSPVNVVNSSFGTFAANSGGYGPSIVFNFVSQTQQPNNSLTSTAKPGQVVTLWGTGLGPVNGPDNVAPAAGNLPTPVEVFVGGQAVAAKDIQYSGRSPCCSGIDQIVFKIPANAPQGCYVPVLVRTEGSVVSNATTIAIQAQGAKCSDPANPFSPVYLSPGKTGTFVLARLNFTVQVDISQPAQGSVDDGFATFRQETGGPFFFNSFFSLPPPGACTVYTGQGNLLTEGPLPGSNATGKLLDAGASLSVTGAKGTLQIPQINNSFQNYYTHLGAVLPNLQQLPLLFLDPGSYTIAGTGGADVGPFQAKINVLAPLGYPSLASTYNVNRAQGITLNWAAPDPRVAAVAILGANYDLPTDSSAAFLCLAPAEALNFTVPPWILGAIPPSRPLKFQSQGYLILGTALYEPSAAFSATGLDTGFGVSIAATGQSVRYQ